MRKRGIFIFFLLTIVAQLLAQQVSHDVLVGTSSIASNGGYFISQTIGEPVVKLIGDESYTLTQGFQQPSSLLFRPSDPEGSGVKVYPNPVKNYLTLELFGEQDLEYHVIIFGFNGVIYFQKDYPCFGNFWHVITIDVSRYQRGPYFVKVVTEDGKISRLFKIDKM